MIASIMEDPEGMANGLMFLGVVLINQGRDTEARPLLEESVALFQELGQEWFATTGIVHLANAALGLGETDAAQEWLEKAVPIARRIGDPWQVAFAVNNLGEVARVRGDYAAARQYYEETAEQYRIADAVGDQARLIHTLGYVDWHEGDLEKAATRFWESLNRFLELGNKRGIAECLAGLAGLAADRGDPEWATSLLSAAEASLTAWGAAWWPADRVEVERARDTLRTALGEMEFTRLWAEGQGMSLDQAVAHASKRLGQEASGDVR